MTMHKNKAIIFHNTILTKYYKVIFILINLEGKLKLYFPYYIKNVK